MTKFETSRFHIEFGPASLFKRILFKFQNVEALWENSRHYLQRKNERNIPPEVIEKVKSFSIDEWKLVMTEVRNDKGKFVGATWELMFNNKRYWVVTGFNNTIQTIIKKDGGGIGKIIRSGKLYDYVEQINKTLMEEEIFDSA